MGQRGNIMSGPRAKLLIDGKPVGYVTDINGAEEIEYLNADVIGNIYTEEHVPVGYRVSFSASLIRVQGISLKQQGIFPRHGDGDPKTFLDNILRQKELTVVLEDQISGNPMETVEAVRITSRSFTVAARGMMGKNITFIGIRMKDESETA